MLKLLTRITKNAAKGNEGTKAQGDSGYIKIRNIYYNFIFALEKNDEGKFFHAAPDEMIGCRPIKKDGSIQKVQTVFFRRNELQLVG